MLAEISQKQPLRYDANANANLWDEIELSPASEHTTITTGYAGSPPWGAPMKSPSSPRLLPLIPGEVFAVSPPEAAALSTA